jgi:hypothetical protein
VDWAKAFLDSGTHVLVKFPLLGAEVSRRYKAKPHRVYSSIRMLRLN